MKEPNIKIAVRQATEFLAAAEALAKRLNTDPDTKTINGWIPPYKEGAALKRASLDLTRSLAVMRQT